VFKIDGEGSVDGAFVDEDISTGQQPTAVTAEWLNSVQSELVALVEMSGAVLSKSDSQQAAKSLINAARIQRHSAYTTMGSSTAFVVSTPVGGYAISELSVGLRIRVKFHTAGGLNPTFYTVGSLLPLIKQYDSLGIKVPPVIKANQLVDLEYDGTDWIILNALPPDVFLPGMSIRWPSSTPPSGWLIRNGAAISRTAYAALFAVIGTTFGAGDGSTTFNLPDDRNRMSIGAGNLYIVGATGGNKDSIVVSHSHTASDSGHAHGIAYQGTLGFSGGGGYGGTAFGGSVNQSTQTAYASISIGTTGLSATNANLPPYLADYGIIKY
jgi:microcystin-dependent protein